MDWCYLHTNLEKYSLLSCEIVLSKHILSVLKRKNEHVLKKIYSSYNLEILLCSVIDKQFGNSTGKSDTTSKENDYIMVVLKTLFHLLWVLLSGGPGYSYRYWSTIELIEWAVWCDSMGDNSMHSLTLIRIDSHAV